MGAGLKLVKMLCGVVFLAILASNIWTHLALEREPRGL